MFINLPMAELRDLWCHCHTVGSMGEKSVPSDHIPVRLTMECTRQAAGPPRHPAIAGSACLVC